MGGWVLHGLRHGHPHKSHWLALHSLPWVHMASSGREKVGQIYAALVCLVLGVVGMSIDLSVTSLAITSSNFYYLPYMHKK